MGACRLAEVDGSLAQLVVQKATRSRFRAGTIAQKDIVPVSAASLDSRI